MTSGVSSPRSPEVLELQELAADRVLSDGTRTRLERVAAWVAAVQAKEQQIRELVALMARQTTDPPERTEGE